jgi:hypothetical protein
VRLEVADPDASGEALDHGPLRGRGVRSPADRLVEPGVIAGVPHLRARLRQLLPLPILPAQSE